MLAASVIFIELREAPMGEWSPCQFSAKNGFFLITNFMIKFLHNLHCFVLNQYFFA
jgi:hypothetical protein